MVWCGCGLWFSSDYNTYPSLDFDFDQGVAIYPLKAVNFLPSWYLPHPSWEKLFNEMFQCTISRFLVLFYLKTFKSLARTTQEVKREVAWGE